MVVHAIPAGQPPGVVSHTTLRPFPLHEPGERQVTVVTDAVWDTGSTVSCAQHTLPGRPSAAQSLASSQGTGRSPGNVQSLPPDAAQANVSSPAVPERQHTSLGTAQVSVPHFTPGSRSGP